MSQLALVSIGITIGLGVAFFGMKLRRVKRLPYWIAMILIILVSCEIMSYGSLAIVLKTWNVPAITTRLQGSVWEAPQLDPMEILAKSEMIPYRVAEMSLHPYLGYSLTPQQREISGNGNESLLPYGLSWLGDIIRSPSADSVVVGIFGGSVAGNFRYSAPGLERLTQKLGEIPQFRGKKIIYSGSAIGGFKQPQPMFALAYLLSLGAHFDVVIEIDGFNEVALAPDENERKKVTMLYPRGWYFLAENQNPKLNNAGENIRSMRKLQATLAWNLHKRPLKYSFTLRLLWLVTNEMMDRHTYGLESRLNAMSAEPQSYAVTGPVLKNKADNMALLVSEWESSSLQMKHLSEGNGALYFHFLQPNQYLKMKPMSEQEKKVAIADHYHREPFILEGYPMLQAAGKTLKRHNVRFHDITDIFKNHPEPLYIDTCCHFSDTGSVIMAEKIGALIARDLRGR